MESQSEQEDEGDRQGLTKPGALTSVTHGDGLPGGANSVNSVSRPRPTRIPAGG